MGPRHVECRGPCWCQTCVAKVLLYDLDGGGGAVAVGGALQVEACCGSRGQFATGEVIVAGVNDLCTSGELIDAGVGGIVDIDDF